MSRPVVPIPPCSAASLSADIKIPYQHYRQAASQEQDLTLTIQFDPAPPTANLCYDIRGTSITGEAFPVNEIGKRLHQVCNAYAPPLRFPYAVSPGASPGKCHEKSWRMAALVAISVSIALAILFIAVLHGR